MIQTIAKGSSGLSSPTGFSFIGANDLLVLEKQTGLVQHVVDGIITGTALDLAVNSASQRGLLSIALSPNFVADQNVFLCSTASSTGVDTGVATEVPVSGNRVDR